MNYGSIFSEFQAIQSKFFHKKMTSAKFINLAVLKMKIETNNVVLFWTN